MYRAIAANKRNTILIMMVFVALITCIGYIFSVLMDEPAVTPWILVGTLIYAVIQYFLAGNLAVAATGAREIAKQDNPRLYRTVENLSITLGMPMPKVYIMDDPAPNAFATGRDPKHAIVAATTGLLEIMDDRELQTVMAHEMGHVQNYDIRVSMIAFGLVSAIAVLSDIALRTIFYGGRNNRDTHPAVIVVGLVAVILAPIIATIVQLAVSRQREYLADATGVMATRDAEGLARALEKLQQYGRPMIKQNSSTAHLFISDPLKKNFLSKLFSTHPSLEDRIKRLRTHGQTF